MSYDPYAERSDVPPPGDFASARQRVQAPAIALIVTSILNLLMALGQVGGTVLIAALPAQQIQAYFEKNLPPDFAKAMLEGWEQDPQSGKNKMVIQNTITSALWMLVAILTLLGGIRMLSLRSYALSIAGAVSAAIPCLSCGGFCCFGEIIGIWALVVLLNAEVRAAFQS